MSDAELSIKPIEEYLKTTYNQELHTEDQETLYRYFFIKKAREIPGLFEIICYLISFCFF
jgi:hypothetical protein